MITRPKNIKIFLPIILILLGLGLIVYALPKLGNNKYTFQSSPTTTYNLPTTTLFFAGDIMLSRNVAAKMYGANDFTLPFKNVSDVTNHADIAFANLESPFLDSGDHSVEGSLIFNADPKSVEGLTYAGFDALSTANNHAMDQGLPGIDYTISILKENHILPIGTYESTNKTALPDQNNVISKNKVAFGFLSYSYTAENNGRNTSSTSVSDFNNLQKLKQDIQTLKGHYADVVIVNMHAGTEYTQNPTQKQIDFAHAAIDAGADLVIGEHPHWVQTVEQYNGKWIFYSLGNFVFDQMWSKETTEGLTLLVTYSETNIQKIELKPVIIENYCCPRWANDEETKSILSKINLTNPVLLQHN